MSNNTETEFVDGLIAKAPHDKAPEFVKARLSIKREELIEWLDSRGEDWINVDIKEARSGKWYAAVDPWKPERQESKPPRQAPPERAPRGGGGQSPPASDEPFPDDDIPFATPFGTF